MFYEPPKNDHGLPLNPFSACIVPRPIGWVSTVDKDRRPNLAPFSFFNGVGYTPPTVMFCPNGRDLDGGLSHSLLNVQETKEFVVNIATFDLRYSMNLTSRQLKRGENEFKLAGLTEEPSRRIQGAYFSEVGFALHKTRLDRKGVRHAHCRGQVRVRDAHPQGGLLQKPRGTRGRMEQQGPVLRSGPEQLSALVRSARDRCRRDHHSLHRAAADLQPTR